ncbi:MAG: hypothetical protein BWY82_02998 [Verrucomicrobia bacterium ADurb.Bin474]|nr:MAG: hypothetical protein BWY82_02998 [Verrucomicrobia bacterium ADurb.Bin474]
MSMIDESETFIPNMRDGSGMFMMDPSGIGRSIRVASDRASPRNNSSADEAMSASISMPMASLIWAICAFF